MDFSSLKLDSFVAVSLERVSCSAGVALDCWIFFHLIPLDFGAENPHILAGIIVTLFAI